MPFPRRIRVALVSSAVALSLVALMTSCARVPCVRSGAGIQGGEASTPAGAVAAERAPASGAAGAAAENRRRPGNPRTGHGAWGWMAGAGMVLMMTLALIL